MSEYNIQINKYDALNAEYDQLYPVTKIEDVDGLDTALQNKADVSSVYTKEESISASTRTALSLLETATPDDALAEIARQLSGTVESTDYPGCYYRTVDGVTEWINPPMILGVEYRTTERYQGKSVYSKLIPVGPVPVDGAAVYIDGENDPHDINTIVMADTYSTGTNQYNNRNYVYIEGGRALGLSGLQSFITLGNNYSVAMGDYRIIVKYTKITD